MVLKTNLEYDNFRRRLVWIGKTYIIKQIRPNKGVLLVKTGRLASHWLNTEILSSHWLKIEKIYIPGARCSRPAPR